MMEHIAQTNCRLIVYNAAYSRVKGLLDHDPTELERYIDVNARTPIRLIHAFVDHYKAQVGKRKGIILMSSLAGWWGTQLLAPYGATKAYNYILAESLHYELQPLNVDVMACIAGATSTPAYLATAPKYGRIRPHIMDPRAVVQGALRKLGRKAIYIPGMHNKFTFFLLSRIFPRSMAAGLMNRTIRQMYGEHSQGS